MRDILKGMRIGLGILLMAGAGLLATVTLPTFTSGANLTAAKLTSAFAALKDAIENINVDAGKSIRHDGTPVWGYLGAGTAVFTKEVICVFLLNTLQAVNTAHAIPNAYTNDRIIAVYPRRDSGSVSYFGYGHNGSGLISTVFWDDTNITLQRQLGDAATVTWKLTIVYK